MPQFKNIKTTADLFANDTDTRPVMVSIYCITYNHAKYIRDALEGFVSQITDFRFEAIVHDDASTDGTDEIIMEYARKYPDIIKPILEVENQYSKGHGSIGKVCNPCMRGKYIAECEGDDYWTDPNKLQKQVDFLESHPDYTLCFHNAMVHYEFGNIEDHIFANIENRDYTEFDVTQRWIAPTASFVYHSYILKADLYKQCCHSTKLICGDLPLIATAARLGKLRGMSQCMGIYRRNETSISSVWSKARYSSEFTSKEINSFLELKRIFGEPYGPSFSLYFYRELPVVYKLLARGDFKNSWIILKNGIKCSPKRAFIRLITYYPRIALKKLSKNPN